MKHVIFTLFIIFSSPVLLWAQATDLIPCNYIDKKFDIKIINTYRAELERIFLEDTDIYSLNPMFIALIAPSFEPERLLIIYKNIDIYKQAEYVIEVVKGKESIWYLVSEKFNALQKKDLINDKKGVPKDFKVSTQLIRQYNSLQTSLALTISKASNVLTSKAKIPINPSEVFTVLDGTLVYYYSMSGSCVMNVGHIEGHPIKLFKITELLTDYVRAPSWEVDEIYKQLEQISKQLLDEISG